MCFGKVPISTIIIISDIVWLLFGTKVATQRMKLLSDWPWQVSVHFLILKDR